MKKTNNGYCRGCQKKVNTTIKRYLSATIGDSTGILRIIWNGAACERLF